MIAALKQRVRVGPGGVVQVSSDELRPGDEAEVIVLVERPDGDHEPTAAGVGSDADAIPPGESAYDGFLKAGVIGIIKDGPSDLSTNPKYMEGFGEDRR